MQHYKKKLMYKDYSQTGEQEFIQCFFNGFVGRYLDIGAYDGIHMSNTFNLLELGWQGVALEASYPTFLRLEHQYKTKRNISDCELVNKALVPNYWKKNLVFYESYSKFNNSLLPIGLGTFSKRHLDKYPWITKTEEIITKTITVNDFISEFGTNFDFVSIDVEELNFELVISIPWDKFKSLQLICIEADIQDYRFSNFFEHYDFKLIAQRGANIFFAKFSQPKAHGLNIP